MMNKRRQVRTAPSAVLMPDFGEAVVMAFKALNAGKASEGQQKLALSVLINDICLTYDLPYRPGGSEGDRETCVVSGRQLVGKTIVRLIKLQGKSLQEQVAEEDAALVSKNPAKRKPRKAKT